MKQTGVNNLSQQLCELCGIEPKLIQINPPMRAESQEEWADAIVKKVYPDFENNAENFVRLFNLQVEEVEDNQIKPTISGFLSDYHWFNDTSAFLEMLIYELKEEDEYNTIENQWRIAIKQAISQAKWGW